MAKLRHREDRDRWEVTYYDPPGSGHRHRYSFEKRGEAKDYLKMIEHKLLLSRANLVDTLALERGRRTRFGKWAESYLEGPVRLLAPGTQTNYREHIKLHLNPVFEKVALVNIDSMAIERFQADRLTEDPPPSPATVNRSLAVLKILLRRAHDAGLLARVPRIRMSKELTKEEPRVLTVAEGRRLIRSADKTFSPMVATALMTGMRRQELLNLRWADVEFRRRLVTIDNRPSEGERTKSGRARRVDIPQELLDILRPLRGADLSERVFGFRDFPKRRWNDARKKAKLTRPSLP